MVRYVFRIRSVCYGDLFGWIGLSGGHVRFLEAFGELWEIEDWKGSMLEVWMSHLADRGFDMLPVAACPEESGSSALRGRCMHGAWCWLLNGAISFCQTVAIHPVSSGFTCSKIDSSMTWRDIPKEAIAARY